MRLYTSAFILAFIFTLLTCLGVIFMKWLIMQVGVTFFALILVIMSFIFVLIIQGEKENGE